MIEPNYKDEYATDNVKEVATITTIQYNTIKGKAANANDKTVLLRKQNESKAEEAIHKTLKATIASLETAIKSTYG